MLKLALWSFMVENSSSVKRRDTCKNKGEQKLPQIANAWDSNGKQSSPVKWGSRVGRVILVWVVNKTLKVTCPDLEEVHQQTQSQRLNKIQNGRIRRQEGMEPWGTVMLRGHRKSQHIGSQRERQTPVHRSSRRSAGTSSRSSVRCLGVRDRNGLMCTRLNSVSRLAKDKTGGWWMARWVKESKCQKPRRDLIWPSGKVWGRTTARGPKGHWCDKQQLCKLWSISEGWMQQKPKYKQAWYWDLESLTQQAEGRSDPRRSCWE